MGAKGPSKPADPERYIARHSAVRKKLTFTFNVVIHYGERHSKASDDRKLKWGIGILTGFAAFAGAIATVLMAAGVLPPSNNPSAEPGSQSGHHLAHTPVNNSSQNPGPQGQGSNASSPAPPPSGSSASPSPMPSPSDSTTLASPASPSPTPSPSDSPASACPTPSPSSSPAPPSPTPSPSSSPAPPSPTPSPGGSSASACPTPSPSSSPAPPSPTPSPSYSPARGSSASPQPDAVAELQHYASQPGFPATTAHNAGPSCYAARKQSPIGYRYRRCPDRQTIDHIAAVRTKASPDGLSLRPDIAVVTQSFRPHLRTPMSVDAAAQGSPSSVLGTPASRSLCH